VRLSASKVEKHNNRREFQRLEEENGWLLAAYAVAGEVMTASIVIPDLITWMGSLLAGTVGAELELKRVQKVTPELAN
jgi:hypothetical protein